MALTNDQLRTRCTSLITLSNCPRNELTSGTIAPTQEGKLPPDSVAHLPRTGFVRLPQVLAPLGPIPVSKSTWWEGVRTGRFPAPVKIGGVTAWRVEDIHALIARISDGELADLQIGEVR